MTIPPVGPPVPVPDEDRSPDGQQWPDGQQPPGTGPAPDGDPAPVRELPEPPRTGDAVVDEAVRSLAGLTARPLAEQVGVYDAVHRTLTERLADVEG